MDCLEAPYPQYSRDNALELLRSAIEEHDSSDESNRLRKAVSNIRLVVIWLEVASILASNYLSWRCNPICVVDVKALQIY
jgi:hypothetical protein